MRVKYEVFREVGGGNIVRDRVEVNEVVGENRVDLRVDDKYKEKDRKRKEGKYYDWFESDKDRSDSRNILLFGCSNIDYKELIKEEREFERWEREKKDIFRDKERLKEKENYVDREG